MSDILSADDSLVLGTADFLAPEQALDAKKADARSDIYSLGCTFYFILCGNVPFSGGTLSERLVRHLFETPVPLARKRPDLPADLAALVHRMLAKNPNERIQTCAEVSSLLRNWLLDHADRQWLRDNPALLGGGRAGSPESPGIPKSQRDQPAPAPFTPPVGMPSDSEIFEPISPDLIPVMDPTGDASTFFESEEFQIPISPVTRLLMKGPEPTTWRAWLERAFKKLRRMIGRPSPHSYGERAR
jgi:serine/threonine protein kinase